MALWLAMGEVELSVKRRDPNFAPSPLQLRPCPLRCSSRMRLATILAAMLVVSGCLSTSAWHDNSFEEMKAQAEQGDADAQFNLAFMYDEGPVQPRLHVRRG